MNGCVWGGGRAATLRLRGRCGRARPRTPSPFKSMQQNRSSSWITSSSLLMDHIPSSFSMIFMKRASVRPTPSSSNALRVCAKLRTVSSFISCASRRRHTL